MAMDRGLRRVLLVIGCAVLVPIVPFVVMGELPGERWLDAEGQSALSIGAVGAALLALDVLLPIPSSVLGALLGGRLGFTLGWFWAGLGLSVGSAIGYLLGRLWPVRFVEELREVTGEEPAVAAIVLSRPVPVLAEAISIAAGVARVPPLRFAAASLLGNVLYAGAMAANGATLLPDGLAGPGLVLPMIVPVAAWLIWRRQSRARAAGKPQT